MRGESCPFRHESAALTNETVLNADGLGLKLLKYVRCAPIGWQGSVPSLTAFSGTSRTRGAGGVFWENMLNSFLDALASLAFKLSLSE